jgi:hypothetical protein
MSDEPDENGTVRVQVARSEQMDLPHRIADPDAMAEALGVSKSARLTRKMQEITQLLWLPHDMEGEEINTRIARALELYESLAPEDGGEAMLAQQMVGTHHAAIECLRRAALPNQTFDGRDMALKHAAKLMALYEKQHRALQKSKGKGQQKVTVEHVHVEAGGQAIVGNVETGGRTSERQSTPAPEARGPEAIDNAPEPPVDLASRSRRRTRQRS